MRVRIIEPTKKVENKKLRVCAYARVSTDNTKQGESLENQITYYERLITSNPEYVFVGIFADKGITGTTENRPEFKRMLDLCRENKIDVIITKSISRFARNTVVMLQLVRELKDLGIEVRFEKENINTLSEDGEFMLTVLSSFAEEESRNVSENLRWSAKKKFQKGELIINTNRFLGYDKDEKGNLVINEAEAKVIQRIFTEYLSGKGVFTIAKGLNAEGIPTVSGARWYENTVLYILKNEKYKGDALLQKYYVPEHKKKKTYLNKGRLESYYIEDNHPAIVSKEMWHKVQEELERRANEKSIERDTKKYLKRYPLTGMLYCSKCGATLQRRTWNSNLPSKKIVWQCSNYIKNGKNACRGTKIDDEFVSRLKIKEETIVEEVIKNGKKSYRYTSKNNQSKYSREIRTNEKENGSLLQGINRPTRTIIKL
ncbi:DNA invertase Pin-like site-specific DNA recombinase [Natranaerovirga pectinivora]|uniref:DNA invertase Pin-like site-specific DNA recombinase n=1 Tax=Natranaerovirga pectinivora TaxID=682400 RepID=A0A4R3MJX4_9FIRM|nr:recombinase family protein [Natranaerovirga pectinivora]TCT14565.1 DNA invertase Pin-like site-specific DNA recombinase [Natranaerovirga pectinivora]